MGEEARNGLMAGVRKVTPAVATTLGSYGKNSLLESFAAPGSYPTNDGFSIINSIKLVDPLEDMGRGKLCEAINRANRNGGDGSSTTCVLTAEILEEGMKHLDKVSPSELKKSLEDCLPFIEKSLKSQRKEIIDNEGNIDIKALEQTATISAESEDIGKRIAEIYAKIGKDGVVNWNVSKTGEDFYEIGTGIKIDGATYASRYMCDMVENDYGYQATLYNPLVLLAKSKITSQSEMGGVDGNGNAYGLLGELVQAGVKDVVIFCDEMESPILNSFVLARAPQALGIRFLVIKMPTVFNDLWWEDLEKASGGRVISGASGIKMKDVKMAYLGTFGKVTATREDTFIDGIKDLTSHLLALKVDPTDDNMARVARLNTKSAVYFVGANSDSTLRQKRDKVEDAINSAYNALHEGIVIGGGNALLNVTYESASNPLPRTVGADILREALKQPARQIMINANAPKDISFPKGGNPNMGFNSRTGKIEDLMESGVVDAYEIVWGAVKNAVSVASGILTCNSVVLLPRNENSVDEALKAMMQTPQ